MLITRSYLRFIAASLFLLFVVPLQAQNEEFTTGDWMWRIPGDPNQPYHVAYVMGARIVEAYYNKAEDKLRAVAEILSVVDYEEFLKKSGYPALMEDHID